MNKPTHCEALLPVAWRYWESKWGEWAYSPHPVDGRTCEPLYAAPPAPEPTAAPADDLERECADADRICAALGLTVEQSRTDGGSLNVPRIIAHISETLTALRESHAFGVAMTDKYIASQAKTAPEPTAAPDDAPADDLVDRLRRSSKANAGTGVGMFADEVLAALAALRAENGRLRDNLAAKTAERDVALGALAEQEERAERAESQLAAAQSVIAAADTQLSRVLHEMAGAVSLCWEPKPTGVFNSTQACEFVAAAIAELRAILHSDAARAAAGGGK